MDPRHGVPSSSVELLVLPKGTGASFNSTEVLRDEKGRRFEDVDDSERPAGFYPWTQFPDDKIQFKKSSLPVKGIIGLVGAILTVLCSWALLFASDHTQQWEHRYPSVAKVLKPASILSAIVSANGILLHMAFSDGIAIAWWVRATKDRATGDELHCVVALGCEFGGYATGCRLCYAYFLGLLGIEFSA